MAIAYLDSSALVKLVSVERETAALEAYLADIDGIVTSRLTVVEIGRAAHRIPNRRLLQQVDEVLAACVVSEITPSVASLAAKIPPPALRSLDAIHLATAMALDDASAEFVTYDERLREAAVRQGLTVRTPR